MLVQGRKERETVAWRILLSAESLRLKLLNVLGLNFT